MLMVRPRRRPVNSHRLFLVHLQRAVHRMLKYPRSSVSSMTSKLGNSRHCLQLSSTLVNSVRLMASPSMIAAGNLSAPTGCQPLAVPIRSFMTSIPTVLRKRCGLHALGAGTCLTRPTIRRHWQQSTSCLTSWPKWRRIFGRGDARRWSASPLYFHLWSQRRGSQPGGRKQLSHRCRFLHH